MPSNVGPEPAADAVQDPTRPRIAVEPRRSRLSAAVEEGGGVLCPPADARALVWSHPADPGGLESTLDAYPHLEWVQLPWAGVEPYVELMRRHAGRVWTCAKGAYAEPVAEHALALGLGGLRGVVRYSRTARWSDQFGTNLLHGRVTILGGGGITRELVRLLEPFDARITVVRNRPEPMAGVERVVGADALHEALPGADLVVLALAVTPATIGIIGRPELELMEPHAWLVNVARGVHVNTGDLVAALRDGVIGGAALDVTDPEPLPDDHPLWHLPNCVITPHTADTMEMSLPLLAARISENVRRFAAGAELAGRIDVELGY